MATAETDPPEVYLRMFELFAEDLELVRADVEVSCSEPDLVKAIERARDLAQSLADRVEMPEAKRRSAQEGETR